MVRQDGETCSLVVTLQGRAHGTEAFLTLEAMERAASLPTDRVLARMVAALGVAVPLTDDRTQTFATRTSGTASWGP